MTKKSKGGRPIRFKEEYCEQVTSLCLLGATDADLAKFFGVDERTINRWKTDHPEFGRALMGGKEGADADVGQRLYQRATGYTHDSEEIKIVEGKIVRVPIVKHYPPDTTAMIFWLKNRRPDLWRDKVLKEVTGKDGGAIETRDLTRDLTREEREARIAELLEKGGYRQTKDPAAD